MSLLPPAVIPTFLSLGPLALLALILPAAFAGLALFLRRWLALLATASVVSLLFLVHACLPGLSGTDGVAGPRVLHAVLAGVAALGSLWAVNRAYRKRESERLTLRPRTLEVLFLASLALIGAGWLFVPFPSGGPPQAYRKETTAAWASVALGAAYALGRWLAPQRTGGEPRGPTVEAVVLATFALGCGVLAATPRPAGAPSPIAVAWTFEPPARGAIISTPLVAGDRIYVGVLRDSGVGTARGAVYGLARDSGHVVWTFDDSKSMRAMYSSPCLSNGRLYIGEGMHGDLDSKLYCLDAATGAKLWDFRTSGHVESSPCVAEGRVLFGAGDDGLYALDAATGARRWHFHGDFHIDASPAVVAGRVYVGSGESRRYPRSEAFCLAVADGSVVWRGAAPLPVWGSPVIEGGQVFFGLGNGRLDRSAAPPAQPAGGLWCVEISSGQTSWLCQVADGVLGKPALAAGRVYFGSRDGSCYALDRSDGRRLWATDLSSPVVTAPAVAGGHLFLVASGGRVARLRADDGHVEWSFDLASHFHAGARLFASPVVVPDPADPNHRLVLVAGEVMNPVSSAAVLLCLRDEK